MQLRQGFGRLIRTKRDKGIIAILDSRIWNRPYGKRFLVSLPDVKKTDSLQEVREWWEKQAYE
jgi:ATP-dependent DNA helicase DinG